MTSSLPTLAELKRSYQASPPDAMHQAVPHPATLEASHEAAGQLHYSHYHSHQQQPELPMDMLGRQRSLSLPVPSHHIHTPITRLTSDPSMPPQGASYLPPSSHVPSGKPSSPFPTSYLAANVNPAAFATMADAHQHNLHCGHEIVLHGDHVDYLVDGQLQHAHGDHYDSHGFVMSYVGDDDLDARMTALDDEDEENTDVTSNRMDQHNAWGSAAAAAAAATLKGPFTAPSSLLQNIGATSSAAHPLAANCFAFPPAQTSHVHPSPAHYHPHYHHHAAQQQQQQQPHQHGLHCGHDLVLHENHLDYLVDGQLHHVSQETDRCEPHGHLRQLSPDTVVDLCHGHPSPSTHPPAAEASSSTSSSSDSVGPSTLNSASSAANITSPASPNNDSCNVCHKKKVRTVKSVVESPEELRNACIALIKHKCQSQLSSKSSFTILKGATSQATTIIQNYAREKFNRRCMTIADLAALTDQQIEMLITHSPTTLRNLKALHSNAQTIVDYEHKETTYMKRMKNAACCARFRQKKKAKITTLGNVVNDMTKVCDELADRVAMLEREKAQLQTLLGMDAFQGLPSTAEASVKQESSSL